MLEQSITYERYLDAVEKRLNLLIKDCESYRAGLFSVEDWLNKNTPTDPMDMTGKLLEDHKLYAEMLDSSRIHLYGIYNEIANYRLDLKKFRDGFQDKDDFEFFIDKKGNPNYRMKGEGSLKRVGLTKI